MNKQCQSCTDGCTCVDEIIEEFEKEFGKEDFPSKEDWEYIFKPMKAFLKKALLQQEEKLLDKAHQESCNGVSQWMNYGKKRGYFDFFEKECKKQKIENDSLEELYEKHRNFTETIISEFINETLPPDNKQMISVRLLREILPKFLEAKEKQTIEELEEDFRSGKLCFCDGCGRIKKPAMFDLCEDCI